MYDSWVCIHNECVHFLNLERGTEKLTSCLPRSTAASLNTLLFPKLLPQKTQTLLNLPIDFCVQLYRVDEWMVTEGRLHHFCFLFPLDLQSQLYHRKILISSNSDIYFRLLSISFSLIIWYSLLSFVLDNGRILPSKPFFKIFFFFSYLTTRHFCHIQVAFCLFFINWSRKISVPWPCDGINFKNNT